MLSSPTQRSLSAAQIQELNLLPFPGRGFICSPGSTSYLLIGSLSCHFPQLSLKAWMENVSLYGIGSWP